MKRVVEIEVTCCDRCGKSGGTMITGTQDRMSVEPREIDLCMECVDVVLPELFAPEPKKRRGRPRNAA